jgi:hypothetical protein
MISQGGPTLDDFSDLRKAHKTSSLVGAAALGSLFFYAVCVEAVRALFKPFLGFVRVEHTLSLRYTFYGAAIILVILNRVLNSFLLRKSAKGDIKAAVQTLSRAALISMALGEAPAVLGLVLFLLGGFSTDFFMLLIVSLFLEFIYFPQLRSWEDFIKDRPLSCRL